MKRFQIAFVLVCFNTLSVLYAQDSINFIISSVPQYLIISAVRIDFDKRINSRHWLVIAPQFYIGKKRPIYDGNSVYGPSIDEDDEIFGVGFDLIHKIFLNKQSKHTGGYIAYGVSYNYFSIAFKSYGYLTNVVNGVTYYENELRDYKMGINKYGITQTIGYQEKIVENIVFDVYVGFGVKYSDTNFKPKSTTIKERHYASSYFDYSFTGTVPILGIRVGVAF